MFSVRDLVRGPGKKLDEIKLQAFSVGYNKIVNDYKEFRLHTAQALAEMRLGVITPGTITFFDKKILHYFFKKDEQGEGLAAKVRVQGIVENWRENRLLPEDSDWLKEVFLVLLARCEEQDLAGLARVMKIEKLLEKQLG